MYYAYLLRLNHKSEEYHIGSTPDIKRRIKQHQDGRVQYTKSKLPIKLIYCEVYSSKKLALLREKNIKKSGSVCMGLMKRLKLK